MADPGIFQFIGESVDTALNSFVAATAGQVIAGIVPIAILGATIYFAFSGYMIIAGRIQSPAGTLMLQAVKFVVLAALALSLDGYNNWVVGTIRGLEDGLAAMFAGSGPSDEPKSVYATVDATLGQGWDIAAQLWEQAGSRGLTELGMAIGEYVNALVIGISTLLVGLPAGALIVVAKATLTLLLGIGPIFVMCLMWSVTARWFEQWFAQVMTAIITIALVAAVAAFMMKIFAAFIAGVDLQGDQNTLFTALTLAVLSLVILMLLYKTSDLAAGLAGGLSVGAITLGRMVTGSQQFATAPGRFARGANNTFNPASHRLDPRTQLQTTSRRLEHVAFGRTIANPQYRQALKERRRSSWSRTNTVGEDKTRSPK